jgi:hypothetical protein
LHLTVACDLKLEQGRSTGATYDYVANDSLCVSVTGVPSPGPCSKTM